LDATARKAASRSEISTLALMFEEGSKADSRVSHFANSEHLHYDEIVAEALAVRGDRDGAKHPDEPCLR
jgi:hypothetical protein